MSADQWKKAVTDAWNEMADTYDAYVGTEADYYRTQVIGPGLLAACGNVRGQRVLDLGCGQGYFSRVLAGAGGTVIGWTSRNGRSTMLAGMRLRTHSGS